MVLTGRPFSILDEAQNPVYLPNHNSQISLARSEIDFDGGAAPAAGGEAAWLASVLGAELTGRLDAGGIGSSSAVLIEAVAVDGEAAGTVVTGEDGAVVAAALCDGAASVLGASALFAGAAGAAGGGVTAGAVGAGAGATGFGASAA